MTYDISNTLFMGILMILLQKENPDYDDKMMA